jgi:glucosamine--fructose-6-phosphate aminotransferase (isomerizing)
MCGIVGCVLRGGAAAPLIYQALKRLEYRGYDSAGVATISDGVIHVRKDVGKVDEIQERVDLQGLPGSVGVGHTRWATHGAPSKENAHPHLDCAGSVAVVHNGVIENFSELKKEVVDEGHVYRSRTDSEVIAHLIERETPRKVGFYTAVVRALRRLEGSYAVAAISVEEPGKVVCARSESPLILGVSDEGVFCASDIPALLPFTRRVVPLRNGEISVLEPEGFDLRRIEDDSPLRRDFTVVEWSVEAAEKQGYPHFMLKEIHEQPLSLRNALRIQESYLSLVATLMDRGRETFLLGAGTSYHACLAASYVFSRLARLVTYPVVASEFVERYGDSVGVDSVVLALSQSGETYDVLRAVDYARMKAATVIGLTNTVGSTLTRVARAYLVQQSGPEIGVAATKTFTAQLMVLTQLALTLGKIRGKLSQDEMDELKGRLREVPSLAETLIEGGEGKIKELAWKYAAAGFFMFLGRGISSVTALEGRLKLMELTYVPSLSYPAGESKHGPISVVEKGVPVVFISPRDDTRRDVLNSMMEMKARGARVIAFCEEGDEELIQSADDHVEIPSVPGILSPILYAVALQLFAYYSAVARGLDPDKPRNLAKSVTVP